MGVWGTWEETEACLGEVVGEWQGPDPVELGSIRRWLEAKEFDSPIHRERAAARAAGLQDVVAPATMVLSYGVAAYWSATPDPRFAQRLKGQQMIVEEQQVYAHGSRGTRHTLWLAQPNT